MKKSIYSSKSSVCYLLGLIYYTGFSEKTVFCLKNEYLGSSFLVPGTKFFAKVLCDLFLKDLWTFLREKRKTLCSPVMARVMELLLDHRCNWRIWPLSRALQLGLEAAFAEGTGWSRATQILLLQEPLVLPAPWWRWGTWCGRWLLLQNILLCAVLHIWVCRNAAAVTIAGEAGLGAAGPGGALVLWETSQEVVGAVCCWCGWMLCNTRYITDRFCTMLSHILVDKWRGQLCEHQIHPIIWDWLNLSLLEAAVFITAIVLLCCYFALEEYLGMFWHSVHIHA